MHAQPQKRACSCLSTASAARAQRELRRPPACTRTPQHAPDTALELLDTVHTPLRPTLLSQRGGPAAGSTHP
jgi:hypothetical protein